MEPIVAQAVNAERPREVAKAGQLLTSAIVIGLLNAIFTLVQRTAGIPMLVALIMVLAFLDSSSSW